MQARFSWESQLKLVSTYPGSVQGNGIRHFKKTVEEEPATEEATKGTQKSPPAGRVQNPQD